MAASCKRNTLIALAQLAEQAGRYNDMIDTMKKLVKLKHEFSEEERRLLSVGYKKVIEAKRASYTTVSLLERNEPNTAYLRRIGQEISDICHEAMWIAKDIISYSLDMESIAFLLKKIGDYLRYVAEVKTDKERNLLALMSLEAYKLATTTAQWADLGTLHPLQLSLVLNTAVLYKDVMGCTEKACDVAWAGFGLALEQICSLSRKESTFEESTAIIRMLRENIALWTDGEIPQQGIPIVCGRFID